jgi:ADP-ribose 1''-phosphate phosphatase
MSDPEIPPGAPPKISSNLKPLNLSTSSTSPPKSPSNIDDDNTSETTTHHLRITSHRASLFASPPHTLLCHATNAQGTWGAGIALAFKKSYPRAFTLYATHCKNFPPSTLLGTTLIIPPQLSSPSKAEREAQHWIGCLFTSEKKGKGKGSKESILEATGEAIRNLVRQLEEAKEEEAIKEVRMCKINSGLFGVPWEATKRVIEGVEVEEGGLREVGVYSLD